MLPSTHPHTPTEGLNSVQNTLERGRCDGDKGPTQVMERSTVTTTATDDLVKPFEVDPTNFVPCYSSSVKPCKEIFPFACEPFADLRPSSCKFAKRGCVVKIWNLSEKKNRDIFVASSTCSPQDNIVYPIPRGKMKHKNIDFADTKIVKCSNAKCCNTKFNEDRIKQPAQFHYCCYVNTIEKDPSMDELVYDEDLDSLCDEQMLLLENISHEKLASTEVVLPVCGKQCYNMMVKARKKKVENNMKKQLAEEESDKKRFPNLIPNQHKRWDNDGGENNLSSEEVIINWITTNENAEMYFGGNHGSNNSTNGISKETYHVRLSNLIHRENG